LFFFANAHQSTGEITEDRIKQRAAKRDQRVCPNLVMGKRLMQGHGHEQEARKADERPLFAVHR